MKRSSPLTGREWTPSVHCMAVDEAAWSGTPGHTWSFGIGSNMNVALVESKKRLKVVEHAAGLVKDWRVGFNTGGIAFVDPSFANACKAPGEEIHGVPIILHSLSLRSPRRPVTRMPQI
jgi:hypothetical protein